MNDYEWMLFQLGQIAFAGILITAGVLLCYHFRAAITFFKLFYLVMWFCMAPGLFIYAMLFNQNLDHWLQFATLVILALIFTVPWYLIAWPEIKKHLH